MSFTPSLLKGLRGVSINLLRLLAPLRRCASTVSSNSPSCDWFSVPPATRCLLVLDCAMAEAGFEGLQVLSPTIQAKSVELSLKQKSRKTENRCDHDV